ADVDGRFPLVLANIQAHVLRELAAELVAKSSGTLILSGLLTPQAEPLARELAAAELHVVRVRASPDDPQGSAVVLARTSPDDKAPGARGALARRSSEARRAGSAGTRIGADATSPDDKAPGARGALARRSSEAPRAGSAGTRIGADATSPDDKAPGARGALAR